MAFCPACRSTFPDDWRKCPKDDVVLLGSERVGKYRIQGIIGAGGMGAVYQAENPDTKAQVAIKLLHPSSSSEDKARERFRREAAAVAKLRTRHVITIHDFGSDDRGTLFLIMELLHGHPLRDEIASGCPPLQRTAFIVDHALRGLASAHRAKVTHRDLKPENIFIADTDDGEVAKLLDFGIARTDAKNKSALTGSGTLMGTPAYMAPEQVAGSRGDVGPWTDVYAMGVILYEMLTGAAPFAADSLSGVLGKILEREFNPLGKVRKDLPKPVYELVDRSMHAQPEERFQSAAEMHEAWSQAWQAFSSEIRNAVVPTFEGRGKRTAAGKPAKVDPHSDTDIAAAATAAVTPELAATAAAVSTPNHRSPRAEKSSVTEKVRRPSWLLPAGLASTVVAASVGFLAFRNTGKSPPTSADASAVVVAKAQSDAAALSLADAGPPTLEDMVYIGGGEFDMGTPKRFAGHPLAMPRRKVMVEPFYIDRLEMTVEGSKLPRFGLTYEQARAACKAQGKRLLTEAEWEYVATTANLDPKGACLRDTEVSKAAPVGTHPGDCSDSGVCDLLGNLLEWVESPAPRDSEEEDLGTVRGASYKVNWRPNSFYATVHARTRIPKDTEESEIGVRCGKSP